MSRITGYQTDSLQFVSTGLCPNCLECMDSMGYDDIESFNQDVENGSVCNEGSFSWNSCDECNTNLGGNSFFAHGIDSNGDLIHFTVCYDCLFELNGYNWNEDLNCYE